MKKKTNIAPSRMGERDTYEKISKIGETVKKVLWWILYIIMIAIAVAIVHGDPEEVQAENKLVCNPGITIKPENKLLDDDILFKRIQQRNNYICRLEGKYPILNITKVEETVKEAEEVVEKAEEAVKEVKQEEPKPAVKEEPKKEQPKQQVASTPSASKSELQSYARDLVINTYGWTEYDFECLVNLWNRESGWNPNAHNKSSGAHGIPQSLPASKMASEGDDYYTNGYTQIRWGLKYIKNRYGSPSNAWSHFQNKNWY